VLRRKMRHVNSDFLLLFCPSDHMRLETTLSVMEGNMEDLMMIKCRLSVNVTVPCCRPTEVGVWVHDRIRLLDPVIVLILLASISES
jgi:hypothetical protein